MSSGRDRQILQARELDKASTYLIRVGANAVKRNPIKVGAYVLGLLLCIFFNGFSVGDTQRAEYYQELTKIDYQRLDDARVAVDVSYRPYYRSKGWFSCNSECQMYKKEYDEALSNYNFLKKQEEQQLSLAKSKLGLFSEYGVEETRNLFWERFAQGKGFASRQSKWDAIFYGIGAMSRDESMISYLVRLGISMLFNFTLGVCGAVVAFIFSLMSLIRTYQASILSATVFFALGSLAAVAFALTWLIGLYGVAAATSYVGLKLVASNMRIEYQEEGRRYRVQ